MKPSLFQTRFLYCCCREPPSHVVTMKRACNVGISIGVTFYTSVAVFGYMALGSAVPGDILTAFDSPRQVQGALLGGGAMVTFCSQGLQSERTGDHGGCARRCRATCPPPDGRSCNRGLTEAPCALTLGLMLAAPCRWLIMTAHTLVILHMVAGAPLGCCSIIGTAQPSIGIPGMGGSAALPP